MTETLNTFRSKYGHLPTAVVYTLDRAPSTATGDGIVPMTRIASAFSA